MEAREEIETSNANDDAVEFAEENSLFDSEISALTRPSDPKDADLRMQMQNFSAIDGSSNRNSRPVSTMLDVNEVLN